MNTEENLKMTEQQDETDEQMRKNSEEKGKKILK